MTDMDTKRYHPIIDWKLTEDEAKAFKLAIVWENQTRKMFPKIKGLAHLSKGNPTKCTLFRYCWKLLRQTRGLLRDDEYPLYILANLQIIKIRGGHVSPNVLCGDKAWVRWKVWKRLYDQKQQEAQGEIITPPLSLDPKIVRELDCTKRFLYEKCEGTPSLEKIQDFLDKKFFKVWTMSGRISYYYIVMSPFVASCLNIKLLEIDLGFDSTVYTQKITDGVRQYFSQEFSYEFLKI